MNEDTYVPSGHQRVMPYLILNNASGFISFMTSVFQAKLTRQVMKDDKTVAHAEMTIGESTIMFADAPGNYPCQPAGLFIYVDDADAVFAKAIMEGAAVVTRPSDQVYGRSAGILDPNGNTWWITSLVSN
jgi:PhnB protein